MWHATLVRETVEGLGRDAAVKQIVCERASLSTLQFRVPKDACSKATIHQLALR